MDCGVDFSGAVVFLSQCDGRFAYPPAQLSCGAQGWVWGRRKPRSSGLAPLALAQFVSSETLIRKQIFKLSGSMTDMSHGVSTAASFHRIGDRLLLVFPETSAGSPDSGLPHFCLVSQRHHFKIMME